MSKAVIEHWDSFSDFLASQPLCRWCVEKQHEIDTGAYDSRPHGVHKASAKKNDNADLAEALASMA